MPELVFLSNVNFALFLQNKHQGKKTKFSMISILRVLAIFAIIWYAVAYIFKTFFLRSKPQGKEEGDVTVQHTKEYKSPESKKKVGEYVDYEEIK